jgi:hypothetical protein
MRFHNRKYRAFNHFLAGQHMAGRDGKARFLVGAVRPSGNFPRDVIRRFPRSRPAGAATPTGGLLRPEFGNKPSIEFLAMRAPEQAGHTGKRQENEIRGIRARWLGRPRL